jgi:hypothetical protein
VDQDAIGSNSAGLRWPRHGQHPHTGGQQGSRHCQNQNGPKKKAARCHLSLLIHFDNPAAAQII